MSHRNYLSLFFNHACIIICILLVSFQLKAVEVGGDSNTGAGLPIFAEPYVGDVARASPDQAQIIFYRPRGSLKNNAATIYVNRMYHTSLVAGGYSSLCLRPGMTEIGLREMKLSEGPKDGQDFISQLLTHGGQTQFVRVKDGGRTGLSLQQVSPKEAKKDLPATRRQIHTRSRVVGSSPSCGE